MEMLKKVLQRSIFLLTPFENFNTCFSIYLRNEFDDHLSIIMIVYGSVFARYTIIAPPDLFEWVPTSLLVKPRTCCPMASTMALVSMRYSVFNKYESFGWFVVGVRDEALYDYGPESDWT